MRNLAFLFHSLILISCNDTSNSSTATDTSQLVSKERIIADDVYPKLKQIIVYKFLTVSAQKIDPCKNKQSFHNKVYKELWKTETVNEMVWTRINNSELISLNDAVIELCALKDWITTTSDITKYPSVVKDYPAFQ